MFIRVDDKFELHQVFEGESLIAVEVRGIRDGLEVLVEGGRISLDDPRLPIIVIEETGWALHVRKDECSNGLTFAYIYPRTQATYYIPCALHNSDAFHYDESTMEDSLDPPCTCGPPPERKPLERGWSHKLEPAPGVAGIWNTVATFAKDRRIAIGGVAVHGE